jgi:glycerol-3-phosphate dehydrogenase
VQRDLDALSRRTFDVLIVGGGIHGLTIACDAAMRGLSVALVDRADFGSGTTFNHLRTIHGGLRYLQTLDVRRARESVRERRTLAAIAPHAVRPLAFALPLYRSVLRGKLAMRAGFLLDRLVALDRNRGIPASHRLPAGNVVSRVEAIERFPGLRRHGLTGAAVWHDYTTLEADRLTFSWAIAAHTHGAVLANYLDAVEALIEGGRIAGVRAKDGPTGRAFDIHAAVTVDTAGGPIAGPGAQPSARIKAMNLVTRRDAGDEALGGRSATGRNLFLVPCRTRAIFGTWESRAPAAPGEAQPTEVEIAAFISELNDAFPALDLRRDDVSLVHRGAVPAAAGKDGAMTLERYDRVQDHQNGAISVAGTKYTTARAVAERVTDLIFRLLQRPPVACRTATTPLPGGDLHDVAGAIAAARREHDARLPSDSIPHLIAAYGTRYVEVLGLAAHEPTWRARVADDSPVLGAELVWAVRHEMAITLSDAVIRRTPLGAMGYPGDEAAGRAASIVGGELGWDADQTRREIEKLRSFYLV